MANYQGAGAFLASFTADEDLTLLQYKLVKAASTVGNVASATSACAPMPIGVLINDPSAGQAATVVSLGWTKAKAKVNACYLSHGVFLSGASDGFLEPALGAAGTEPIMGRWFGSRQLTADTSVLGDVLLFPLPACIAASQAAAY